MGGIFCKLFRKRQLRVLINGLDAAGKTTLLYQLKLGEVVTTIPTIGFNIETLEHNNVELTTWDLGGRDKARPLYRHYYPGTDAIVFVVDSNDRERIDEIQKELHTTIKEDELREIIVVIAANKQDIHGVMTPEEVGEKMNVEFIRKSHRCEVFGTSATTGEGLYEMLDWVVEAVSTKQAAKVLGGTDKCITSEKEEKDSKSLYFSSTFSYIKNVFSKV
ncbi:uncharacterized protein [Argopecten irradians]|uniref:uncharacterized protein n=1 Tax=Argopecten irradians TaxID=31199 RepID=UPI0037177A1E